MIRKFALATFAVAAMIWVIGLFGGPEPSDAQTTSIAADTVGDLTSLQGIKPLPEIIDFWQARADAHPLDYLSRTELGLALNAGASETADLDLYREGEAVFREAVELNPRHVTARLGLASSLTAQHRFTEAIEQINNADHGNSAPALALLGDASLGFGETAEAAAAYEQLIATERSAPTVSRLARLRWVEGRSAESVELAREALALSDELALRPNTRAFYRFQLAHFLFAAGEVDESTAMHLEALEFDPEHPGASESLAFNLASTGDFDAAAARYEALIERSPAADLHGLYADVLRMLGRNDEADVQEQLGEAAAVEALDEAAERRHLVSYYLTRDPDTAVELAEADLEERHDVGAYDALAWALFHADRVDEAAEMIDHALATGTADAAILYHAAAIANARGDSETARLHLDRALDINPTFHPTEAGDAHELAERIAG